MLPISSPAKNGMGYAAYFPAHFPPAVLGWEMTRGKLRMHLKINGGDGEGSGEDKSLGQW